MDVAKVKARAAEIDQEQQAAQAAQEAENNKSFLDRVEEGAGRAWNIVKNGYEISLDADQQQAEQQRDYSRASYNVIEPVASAVGKGIAAVGQMNATADEMAQKGANGDYNAENTPFSDLNLFTEQKQQAEDAVSTATTNVLNAPRRALRNFMQDNPEDPFTLAVEYSDFGQNYIMNSEEKIVRAKEIESTMGIPARAILSDNNAYSQAIEYYAYKRKKDTLDEVWEKYPEIKEMANMDPDAAAIALNNAYDVENSHTIVDTAKHVIDVAAQFYERGNIELEYNNLQYKLMNGTADDNDKQRMKDLKEQLDAKPLETPSFATDPLGSMAAQVANSLPEMGQSTGEAILVAVATAALVAGAAASETGLGAVVAGGAGAFLRTAIPRILARQAVKQAVEFGVTGGAALGMYRPEAGRSYSEMGEAKKADGTPLYTDEERAFWSPIRAGANTILEVAPTAKVGGGIMKKAFTGAPQAERVFKDAVGEITAKSAQKQKVGSLVTEGAKDWLKLTVTESGEEAAQSAADDTIMNLANRDKGEDTEHFNIATIAQRAGQSFVESIPGSMGFATLGLVGGTVARGGRLAAARRRANQIDKTYGKDRAETMMGTVMVEQLQQATEKAKLNKVAPDVQRQVLREQLKNTPFQTAYIDVEMAVKKENGLTDLQNVAKAQGISGEELQTAIDENGYIAVPVETLAQVKSENSELLDSVSFKPEAESMARMRENGKKLIEDYTTQVKKATDRQEKLVETIANNYIPNATAGQKKLLKAAITANPVNPSQGWRTIHNELRAQLQEQIQPALDALKQGMGNAGILDVKDEIGNDKTIRYTENDEWYRNFYHINKRKPTKAELEDMAIAMVTGDKSAPKVYGWTIESAEAEQAAQENKPIIDAIKKDLADMETIKPQAMKLTSAEMELTEGLTPEGMQVYRLISDWADRAGGKVARQGRMGAILVARNADIYAKIVREKTGQNYTAMDYLENKLAFYADGAYLQENNITTKKPAKPPEVEKLGQTLFQIVWHGSPYYFTAFDLSHMGEGEGAQAHGWGIYLALDRAVSEHYRDKLSTEPKDIIDYWGDRFEKTNDGWYNLNEGGTLEYDSPEAIAFDAVIEQGGVQEAIKELKEDIENDRAENEENTKAAINFLESEGDEITEGHNGVLYKVDIPDDDVLLDEQKTFKEQPAKVQEALKKVCESLNMQVTGIAKRGTVNYNSTGKAIYNQIAKKLGGDKETSLALNKAGIKGITYEGAQDGRCFVIFDDKAAQIVETYNQLAQGENTTNPIESLLQTAFHGSGYNFNHFDLGAIGSGSGTNMHGWGIYFTKSKKVARNYKKELDKLGEGHIYEAEIPDNKYLLDEDVQYWRQLKGVQKNILKAIKGLTEKQQNIFIQELVKYKKNFTKNASEATANVNSLESLISTLKEIGNPQGGIPKFRLRARKDRLIRSGYTTKQIETLKADEKTRNAEIQKKEDKLKEEQKKLRGAKVKDGKNRAKFFKEVKADWGESLKRYALEGKTVYEGIAAALGNGTHTKDYKAASEYLNKYDIKGITYDNGPDGRCFVIFDDKAIDIIQKYNQAVNGRQLQGNTNLMSNGIRIVEMMESADESTFMHEMGHVFLYNLEDLANINDEESIKQLETVNKWANWNKKHGAAEYKGTPWEGEFREYNRLIRKAIKDGDIMEEKRWKAVWRQERFARGFEMYLKDGKAPAKGLKAVFRQFKKFLRIIYNAFVGDGGKPSEPVRRVMDRMIASEEEIEAAALDSRYSDITKAGGEKLLTESEEETYKRWIEEERETAKEKLLKELMKDFDEQKQRDYQKALDEERENYTRQVQQESIYIAEQMLKEPGARPEDVQVFGFESYEDYKKQRDAAPDVETVVKDHMDAYGKELDAAMIEVHLTPEMIDEKMQSTEYREKMENMVARGMERKKNLVNKINDKAEIAMQNIEDRLKKMPESVDFKVDQAVPEVKDLMTEINRLRFANKWSAADIRRIEQMLKANTKEQVKEALDDFKRVKRQTRDIEEVTKGKEEYYKKLAAHAADSSPMSESCNVTQIRNRIRKAERNIKTTIKRNNWDLAVQQQEQKAFYIALEKEARKNREKRDKITADLKRKTNRRSVKLPANERYWFDHLCYILRIRNNDVKKPEEGFKRLQDLFQEQIESLDLKEAPEDLIALSEQGEKFAGIDSLSLVEYKNMADSLKRLYNIGKYKFNLKTIGGRSISDVQKEIINDDTGIAKNIRTVLRAINPDTGGINYNDILGKVSPEAARKLQEFGTTNLKAENLLKLLGEKAHRYIYGTLERAAEKEAELAERNIKALKEICSMYTQSERRKWTEKKYTTDFIAAEEGGMKISKEQIFCMALNWGTEANRQRLLGGLAAYNDKSVASMRSIETEILKLFQETMTRKDWEFVQKLWDHIGSFWDETAATEEQLNGVALEKVKAQSFDVVPSDAKEPIRMEGGYFPIKYNPEKSAKAQEQDINAATQSYMAGSQVFGVGRGFTKGRVQFNIYRPLQLSFSVIDKHLSDVIHNIAYRVPLRDVYRILQSKQLTAQNDMETYIRGTLGMAAYNDLNKWVLGAWTQIKEQDGAEKTISWIFGALRRNATTAIMGFHLWPCVENISNIALAMNKLGPIKTAAALVEFYAAPLVNMRKVRSLSIFMRERKENLDRDTQSKKDMLHADWKVFEVARDHAYDLMAFSDRLVSEPLWLQAYKDAYQPALEAATKERDDNVAYRLKLQEQVDSIKAEITDAQQNAQKIQEEIEIRNNGTPDEVTAIRDASPWGGLTTTQLRTEWANQRNKARDQARDLWKAEAEFEQAQDLPVWSDTELLDEAQRKAVYAADGVIRDTFGSGRAIDQTTIQRSRNEFIKLLTSFYGFFATQYNALFMAYAKGKFAPKDAGISKWGPLAKTVFYNIIIMSVIGSTLQFGLGLAGSDDDDKKRKVKGPDGKDKTEEVPATERYLKVLAKNMLSIITGGIPVLRDVGNITAEMAFGGGKWSNLGDWKLGTVATRGANDTIRLLKMVWSMGEKNAELDAKAAKKEQEYQEKLRKAKGKKREELIAKHEEAKKYEKPQKHITYSDVLAAATRAGADLTAARTGITADPAHAIPVIMQYMNDQDARYDPTMKNIIWSILFGKKPVEREIPEKPPAEPKPKKGKGRKKKENN